MRRKVAAKPEFCDGCLMLHDNGEVYHCTQELQKKKCAGHSLPHLAGVVKCRVKGKHPACDYCLEEMTKRMVMAPVFVVSEEEEDLRFRIGNHGQLILEGPELSVN